MLGAVPLARIFLPLTNLSSSELLSCFTLAPNSDKIASHPTTDFRTSPSRYIAACLPRVRDADRTSRFPTSRTWQRTPESEFHAMASLQMLQ